MDRGNDAKTTRDLASLAVLSLFCAGVALISDHLVLGLVFFVLGGLCGDALGRDGGIRQELAAGLQDV
ncbi:MAG TPA: hypothetical protein VNY06_00485 [Methylocella sp.]|nr:hypothetical protein [Methylocella sp.]